MHVPNKYSYEEEAFNCRGLAYVLQTMRHDDIVRVAKELEKIRSNYVSGSKRKITGQMLTDLAHVLRYDSRTSRAAIEDLDLEQEIIEEAA